MVGMQPTNPTWRIPAWLLSLVVHLAVLLALALLLRPVLPQSHDERDRQVGIVLASRETPLEVEYFDGADAQSDKQARLAAESASASGVPVDALPSSEAPDSRLFSEIPLPALPAGSANVDVGVARATALARTPLLPGVGDDEILAAEAARLAALPRKGPATRLSIFGSGAAVGNSFVFLLDRSRSMGGEGLGAIAAAEKELTTALDQLGPQHRFQVIAYHQQPVFVGSRKLLDATNENKQSMQQFFKDLLAYGGTQHETALFSAMYLEPDVIFLLTDGGDPYLSDRQIEAVTRHNDGKSSIHCIQFGFGAAPGNSFMQELARRNHGSYGYVDMSK